MYLFQLMLFAFCLATSGLHLVPPPTQTLSIDCFSNCIEFSNNTVAMRYYLEEKRYTEVCRVLPWQILDKIFFDQLSFPNKLTLYFLIKGLAICPSERQATLQQFCQTHYQDVFGARFLMKSLAGSDDLHQHYQTLQTNLPPKPVNLGWTSI